MAPVPTIPNPLFRNEIEVAQFSCNFGPHFALNDLPIRKPDRRGVQVIRPMRPPNFMPQPANQASDQAPDRASGAEPFRSTRHEPRSAAALSFAACGLASTGRFFVELCHTVNISRSGCSLLLRTRPQADSALVLRAVPGGTSLPEGTSQLLFQLAWVRPADDGWLIGAFALGKVDLVDLCRLAFPPYTP